MVLHTDPQVFEPVGEEVRHPLGRALQHPAHDQGRRIPHDPAVAIPHAHGADDVDETVLVFEIDERDPGCRGRPLAVGYQPRDFR